MLPRRLTPIPAGQHTPVQGSIAATAAAQAFLGQRVEAGGTGTETVIPQPLAASEHGGHAVHRCDGRHTASSEQAQLRPKLASRCLMLLLSAQWLCDLKYMLVPCLPALPFALQSLSRPCLNSLADCVQLAAGISGALYKPPDVDSKDPNIAVAGWVTDWWSMPAAGAGHSRCTASRF